MTKAAHSPMTVHMQVTKSQREKKTPIPAQTKEKRTVNKKRKKKNNEILIKIVKRLTFVPFQLFSLVS